MSDLQFDEWPLDEEVTRFLTDSERYVAFTASGMELRITRARAFQPPMEDPDDFPTFMWTETLEGYFLMRQHIVQNHAQGWRLIRRILPRGPRQASFFYEFEDQLLDYIERNQLNHPLGLGNVRHILVEEPQGRAESPRPDGNGRPFRN
ncbi:MAG TPA: hypothetical protein VNO81_00390 [Candidatus Nitrosotenuis sp.]|jgi:hypothetical protein|nr:hypothetical protein [Candidatus Nitrosotenuis sp.]